MHYTIYKITNQVDGKIYIGSHKTENLDDKYMGSGKYLLRAQEKYGIENFKKEILFVYDNPEDMYTKEAEIVNEDFIALNNTYNLKSGGFGGWDYVNRNNKKQCKDPEARNEKIRQKLKALYTDPVLIERSHNNLRNSREKISLIMKERYPNGTFYGKTHNEETKRKIGDKSSVNQKGSSNSKYDTMWITNESEDKKIKKGESIPEGYRKGRKRYQRSCSLTRKTAAL